MPTLPHRWHPGALPEERHARVPEAAAGRRLDQALAELWPEFSRSRIAQWLDSGQLLIDDRCRRRRDKAVGGERACLRLDPVQAGGHAPQAIAFEIVFEDEHLLVIDKPAGLVVHPAAGHPDGTLLNALLNARPALEALPRGGIVHRLDKDTSGLLAVAKTLEAHHALVTQLRQRSVHREYRALVVGESPISGRIDAPLGRHPTQRTKMAVTASGRPAITDYRLRAAYRGHSLLEARLHTGRTHQIRVHMAHIRLPLLGDPVYGVAPRPPRDAAPGLVAALRAFPRQALHAMRLGLHHPATGAALRWEIPMAPDLDAMLRLLAVDAGHAGD